LNKKNNSNTVEKKSNSNRVVIGVVIVCTIISLVFLFLLFNIDSQSTLPLMDTPQIETISTISDPMESYIDDLSNTHTIKVQTTHYLDFYLTPDDVVRINQNLSFVDGIRIDLNESTKENLIPDILRTDNSVVIYPVFTSAAYNVPGFYTYFAGRCDESCVTDVTFENPEFQFTSSGASAQILYHAGYDFLTDVQVDRNPEILENYDTVILLHNEYVTQTQFDVISTHPNLIFLHPNALYALVTADYENNTITLIRGHDYPPENPVSNAFDYEIEKEFHKYEYDTKCEDWKFIEVENGFHLNCYPETVLGDGVLDILKKLPDL